ncbi:5990_t:CDS:2 [Ambispora leptoticha]|uniref:5990_t:CDS:1 n=1 Tax=Ambispora leptoticha TaxID=144679 RepID=A0A9N9FXI6_9GLOM|nr:5990_t:CDS:2 [Ambispora leptoticha]
MLHRPSSSPIRPVSYIDVPKITHYQQQQQQQWSQEPLISPSILPFELGSTIEDPVRGSSYTLIQLLGNGSYAVVYMVLNKKDNKYYALKCLSKANLNEYYLAIQQNEVLIHEKVNGHPNLVHLHHTFETPDWLFLVMEYCEGQDLYFWLTKNQDYKDAKTGRQYTENERLGLIKQVFMQILEAVGHCHNNGIAHRDLKPENFIVTVDHESGNVLVQLTDFGLATDELESTDFDCGSKPYMSYGMM